MKNLKTFESFNNDNSEQLNEGVIRDTIGKVLSIPIYLLSLLALQTIVPAKLIKDRIFTKLLDIYFNLDKLIIVLENAINDINITDREKYDIKKKLKNLKGIKEKYNTLEDYKKQLCKMAPIMDIRNKEYLRNQVIAYKPKEMLGYEVLRELEQVSKKIDYTHLGNDENDDLNMYSSGKVSRFQDRLNKMKNKDDSDIPSELK
jgi:hypothetical protein